MAARIPATPGTELFSDIFNLSPIGIAVESLDGKNCATNTVLTFLLLKTRKRTGRCSSSCELEQ
jgi:hypothetical protein